MSETTINGMNDNSRVPNQTPETSPAGHAAHRPTQYHANHFEDIIADENVFQLIGSSSAQTTMAKTVSAKAHATQCFGDMSDTTFQQISKDRCRSTEKGKGEGQDDSVRHDAVRPGRRLGRDI
ncbi:hypothetical protein ASPBRDRAFT_136172 [Aspergillus brasiliensis CBS 101740]|uniref:Uncharacterized protein n=1 Tax=Aspergillus brasiliensis (strain CBS 101740 / IMI 381727 / IBT 21946) TaxID=767769 RepID=A0A1L9U6I3_ASPBC|nr:hypothetical protein ASPBRDRAFT_136172 [Aspergillus brasiliensis CBS 101740]